MKLENTFTHLPLTGQAQNLIQKTEHEPPKSKALSTHKEDDRLSIHTGDDEM